MIIKQILPTEERDFGPFLTELERNFTYPFGNDFVSVDHGENYFSFFKRLGETHFYIAVQADEIVAIGAGILRSIPTYKSKRSNKIWYLCNLKVLPDFRGAHLPFQILNAAFNEQYQLCQKAYTISMNPIIPEKNRINNLLKRYTNVKMKFETILYFYSLSCSEMLNIQYLLIDSRGPLNYLSLKNKKQLYLKSTGKPLQLLHLQHGPCAETGFATPQENYDHMFCLIENDPLVAELELLGIQRTASASILQHNMDNFDWSFILTSDI